MSIVAEVIHRELMKLFTCHLVVDHIFVLTSLVTRSVLLLLVSEASVGNFTDRIGRDKRYPTLV